MAKDKHAQKKKREERNKQIRLNAEAQRRQEQAPKLRTPSELLKGFSEDILNLMQHNSGLKMFIKSRIEMARELKESDPMKFNELRVDTFTELQKKFEPVDDAIRTLAGIIGSLEDMQTFHEKMLCMADNFETLAEAQRKFEHISREIQEVDFHFNKTLTALVNPAEQMQDLEHGDGEVAPLDFVPTDGEAEAEVAPYSPDGEMHTDELTGGLPSEEGEAVGGFVESGETAAPEVAMETTMPETANAPAETDRSTDFEIPLNQEEAQKVIDDQTAPAQPEVASPVTPVE